jgi:hypothetical protein
MNLVASAAVSMHGHAQNAESATTKTLVVLEWVSIVLPAAGSVLAFSQVSAF